MNQGVGFTKLRLVAGQVKITFQFAAAEMPGSAGSSASADPPGRQLKASMSTVDLKEGCQLSESKNIRPRAGSFLAPGNREYIFPPFFAMES